MCVAMYESQRAARGRLQCAGDAVGLFDAGEDLARTLVIGLADLSEADSSRCAVEEPHAEPVLKRLNMVAHHRDRHVRRRAAAEKPPLSDNATEYGVRLVSRSILAPGLSSPA